MNNPEESKKVHSGFFKNEGRRGQTSTFTKSLTSKGIS